LFTRDRRFNIQNIGSFEEIQVVGSLGILSGITLIVYKDGRQGQQVHQHRRLHHQQFDM